VSKKTFSLALVAIIAVLTGVGFFTWNILNGGSEDDAFVATESQTNETNTQESSPIGESPSQTSEPFGFYDNIYVSEEPLSGPSETRNVYTINIVEDPQSSLLELGEELGMGKGLKVEETPEEIFVSKNPGEPDESRLSISLRDTNGYFSFWRLADPKCTIITAENEKECGGTSLTVSDAEKQAKKIVQLASGLSENDLEENIFESENRIAVLIKGKIDGVTSDQLTWVFDFGKDGVIYSASGYLSSLESVGAFKVLPAEETITRGNDTEWKQFVFPGPPNPNLSEGTLPNPEDFLVAEKKISFVNKSWVTYFDSQTNKYFLMPSWLAGNYENVDTWNFVSLNNMDMKSLGFVE
jgi:hypothetical protein